MLPFSVSESYFLRCVDPGLMSFGVARLLLILTRSEILARYVSRHTEMQRIPDLRGVRLGLP